MPTEPTPATPPEDLGEGGDPADAEFGPGGYLPPRAAARARKIVLRERMGIHWPIAAAVAGVLILAVLIPAVLSQSAVPGEPFVEVGPLAQVDPRGDGLVDVAGQTVLVVRGGGVLQAFLDPPDSARYCDSSRRIEDGAGNVWSLQGRRVGGNADSLPRAGVMAVDDLLYLNVTDVQTPAAPAAGQTPSTC